MGLCTSQIFYNGPLSFSSLPCTFLASCPSILMNHPLPPKPPISMYFHVYSPACKPATILRDAAPSPYKDSVICLSSKDIITRLENDQVKASNSEDSKDYKPPYLDELFACIRNNSKGRSCEALAVPPSVDNRLDLDGTSSTTSEVRGTGLSYNDIATAKHLTDGSKGGLSDTLGSKGLVAACLVGESQTAFSGCSAPQPVTEATMCIPFRTSRSKRHNGEKPTSNILGYADFAAGRGPRTRARARAESSRSFPNRQRARPYSEAEDTLLRELVDRRLQWEQIEEAFGRRFAGRDLKSLQGHWSRNLKFVTQSAKCVTTKRGEMEHLDRRLVSGC
ncbi:hypothetical protein BJX76DRAFT_364805 [Aspergillus varians]